MSAPGSRARPRPDGALLDRLVVARALEDALDVDRRQVDQVGVERADRDELLDLDDGHLAGLGAQRVEVARGLAEHQVAPAIAAPRLDDREVAADRVLEHAAPAVDLAGLLAVGDLGAVAGRRVERLDPGAAGAQPLGERALRT